VRGVRADGWVEVETKNRFAVGDTLEIIHPSGNRLIKLQTMQNAEGQPIDVAAGNPLRVWFPLEGPAQGALVARLLQPAAQQAGAA
ncbi:MAG: U32 family peptidase C-terminal domain-containing protein, partial [Comamonadaceae bacterium]|nr:U32 family peptidase C-terminal domain-containing protein [Comamonadaceae bacterium]